jgi:hypothetical protein
MKTQKTEYNGIKLNDFQFWKHDFKISNQDMRTFEITPRITELNWFTPIGFTKNNSLIVIDVKGKKQWIKEDFWNSSSSPYWKQNPNYGIFVRVKNEQLEYTEMVKIMMTVKRYDQDLNN